MLAKTTKSSFGSVYLQLGMIVLFVMASFFLLFQQYVSPKLIEARAMSLESLFRSHEADLLLNKTRSLKDELIKLAVLQSESGFRNFASDEKALVEPYLKKCKFITSSICVGNSQAVFLQGNSARPPKDSFNFAIVLDTNLARPPLAFDVLQILILLGCGLAFSAFYRSISKKEDFLVKRLNEASSSFSRVAGLLSNCNSEDEFDAFGKGAEALVKTVEDYKAQFERRTRLEQFGLTVGQMSHDLKAPLNEVDNFLSALPLLQESLSGEEFFRVLESIRTRIKLGKLAFENALLTTRQEAVHREPVALLELLTNVQILAARNDKISHLTIDISAEEALVSLGEPTRLETALLNLLENSAEHSSTLVKLRASAGENGMVRLLIEDNGCGIAPELEGKLFEPLASFRKGGTGFGLFGTKEIVAQHLGRIRVQPSLRGAAFEILLPSAEVTHA